MDARKRYFKITVLVTLVCASDAWSNMDERERNEQAIANARLITIEKTMHFTSLEKTAEVARIILS